MSNELDSLAQVDSGVTSLDELVPTVNTAEMPITNKSTASSMAAHAALLVGPDEALDVYNETNKELMSNTTSAPVYENVMSSANKREEELTIQQMGDILTDDSIPIEQKVGYASMWQMGTIQPDRKRSPQELVGINQIEQDSVVENSEEVDHTRFSLAAYMTQINEYNAEVQKMVNEADAEYNPSIIESGKNLIETFAPFLDQAQIAEVQTKLRVAQDQGDINSVASGIVKSFGMLGESKEEIKNFISNLPIDKRLSVAKDLYEIVKSSGGSILGDTNSMQVMDNLRQLLVAGEYGNVDRAIDDITSVLDLVGLGATVRAAKKGVSSAGRIARFTKRSPLSAGETVAKTNTKSANALLEGVVKDETGEFAKNVYNTSRDDVIVTSVGPEIANSDGLIKAKPVIDDTILDVDEDVVKQVAGRDGNINFSRNEKVSKLNTVSKDFLNLDFSGVNLRREMTSISGVDEVDGGIQIKSVIGPVDGGFKNGLDGAEQVKLATKKYGIKDEDITILKRTPEGEYKTFDGDASVDGDYLISLNHTTPYDPSDPILFDKTTVGGSILGVPLNIFDRMFPRFGGKNGSITQHLIPPSAIVDPLLTRSASVAVDNTSKSVGLLFDMANQWASKYNKLGKVNKEIIDDYILRANHDSIKFNPEKLKADGWTDNMVDAYKQWKRTNDTIFELENIDLVRQSKRKGFEMFRTADGQDQFLVKPINNQVASKAGVTKVYDPELGHIREISLAERTELYSKGGTIAMARTPIEVGGESIAYVKVSQTQHNYTRALRESDRLLNYRDGHFTIYYKDPVFITKEVVNADGTKYTKAIATARNKKDAEAYLKRVRASDPNGVFNYRPDLKGEEFDEMMFNSRANAGRTAQRTRGEMLEDASARPTDMEFRHIAAPEESLTRSINSIAKRVNMKEWIDTSKARFEKQYKEFLPIDPNTHARYWPEDASKLIKPTGEGSDMKAYHDALSTFRYIDQIENGFINLIDDYTKNMFKAIADTASDKGFSYLETGARALGDASPTAYMRKKAFRLLLAASPVRQVIVQASQALPIVLATNPTIVPKIMPMIIALRYIDRGGDSGTFIKAMRDLSGMSLEEAKALEAAYRNSGIASAVSAHSLIRDDLKRLVNRTPYQKIKAAAGKPLDIAQRVGFEAGENILMKTVWVSEYQKAMKAKKGVKLTKEELNLLHARVRDLTLNMNRAGELAYNENTFSAIMQFAQAPHKAFAQIVMGNRALSRADRLKLGTAYVATYGTGFGVMFDQMIMPMLGDVDNDTRDIIVGGLFNAAMNAALSAVYGEDVNTDFSSSMRLLDIPKIGDMFEAAATMDMESLITQSPSISLVVGDNARVTNFVKSVAGFFAEPTGEGNLKDVSKTFLSTFSGFSAGFKAIYALEHGRSVNTKGEEVDGDVNAVEAVMKIAGFGTMDEMLKYETNADIYENSKAAKDDVKYFVDEMSRRMARDGIATDEVQYVLRLSKEANRVYASRPKLRKMVVDEIKKRVSKGDNVIFKSLTSQAGIVSEEKWNETLVKAPLNDKQKDTLRKIRDTMYKNGKE